jgi:homoserine kinase
VASFEVAVPASSGNVGAGFDVFGLALELRLVVGCHPAARLEVIHTGEGAGEVATDTSHLVIRSYLDTSRSLGVIEPPPRRFEVRNPIPLGRGLGSSGAAIAAGVLCVARVLGRLDGLDDGQRVGLAARLEGHPDNVAASLLGGLVLALPDPDATDGAHLVVRHPVHRAVWAALGVPSRPLPTREARRVLPAQVPLGDAVANLQSVALLPPALAAGDGRLRRAMQDRLHQPARAPLVPGLAEALELRAEGLLGVALSGAGPTLIGLCAGKAAATRTAGHLAALIERAGCPARPLVVPIARSGATVRPLD